MNSTKYLAICSASEYYDALMNASEPISDAVYYLLRHRLSKALEKVYELHGFGLDDPFEDTVDDFFLYLYDWGTEPPFAILGTVREKEAFFGWTVGTYRIFLLNKAKEDLKRKEMLERVAVLAGAEDRPVAKETLIDRIAMAIAHADQELKTRNRFIFYRMLLTFLDAKRAVPQEWMAQAMEMHPVTYRVCVNRLRARLSNDLTDLEQGSILLLDADHSLMRDHLIQGFDQLYESLIPYYEATLHSLSQAIEIDALRQGFSPEGITMHESLEYGYPHAVDVEALYERLKS